MPKYLKHHLQQARNDYKRGMFRGPSDPAKPTLSILVEIVDVKYGWDVREKVESYLHDTPNHVWVERWAWKELERLRHNIVKV